MSTRIVSVRRALSSDAVDASGGLVLLREYENAMEAVDAEIAAKHLRPHDGRMVFIEVTEYVSA